MAKHERTNLSPSERSALSQRVAVVAEKLPYDYINWVVVYLPHLDDTDGKTKIKGVKAQRTHDEEITTALEVISEMYQGNLSALEALGEEKRREEVAV